VISPSLKALLLLGLAGTVLSGCVYHTPRAPLSQHADSQFYKSDLPGFSITQNRFVARELDHLLYRDPNFIPLALSRKAELWDQIHAIFIQESMPLELLSVAIVESGLRIKARSPRGAAGLWQFTKPTASAYGLSVGLFQDQRYDPSKSTRAALRHLRDLYKRYDDWNLALAAYNAGPGLVDRICKEEGSTDFWELLRADRFPKETRRYVPRILAASILIQEYAQNRATT